MLFQQTISTIPFRRWLYKDKENQQMFCFALVALTASFTWLKIIYPYPNFMPPDSYNYLEAAYNNEFINIWPIGYSKFLQLVSLFNHAHIVLVIVQYVVLQSSLFYLLYSIRYLLSPGKWLFRILLSISILNPLLPHIANYVSSDCLFTTLSIIWCTQLLWIINRPSRTMLVLHAVTLLFAFMVRYNALYYPLISGLVIVGCRISKGNKRMGIVAISTLLLAFIGRTQYEYNKKTGTTQYSAFAGWQMAANALYAYAHATPVPGENVPPKFRELHKVVNQHMDSLRHVLLRPDREIGIYYLWDFKSPLRVYMENTWRNDTLSSFFKKWAFMAPLYGAYGRYLISRYPFLFLRYYAWPNVHRYSVPPSYFMGIYNMGFTTVEPIVVKWFALRNNKLVTNTDSLQIPVANVFSIIVPVVNLIFITGFLAFIGLSRYKKCSITSKMIINYVLIIWVSNVLFSVFSAPIELRYQLFALIITLIWAILFIAYITQLVLSPTATIKANQKSIPAVIQV